MRENRAPTDLSEDVDVTDFGMLGREIRNEEGRPWSFFSEDNRRERDMAPGLRSHPVGTRNTLEDLGFPFARRLSASSFSSAESGERRGPLAVVGGLRGSVSPSVDSLTDPEMPFRMRTRSPSPLDEYGGATRMSVTPSESISRVLAKGYPSVTPSESVSRVAAARVQSSSQNQSQSQNQTQNRPSLTPSENFLRLFGRKSTLSTTTEDPSSSSMAEDDSLSVAELPIPEPPPPARKRGQTTSTGTSSLASWPMPPAGSTSGLRNWRDLLGRKSGAKGWESRWSETQRDSRPSGVGVDTPSSPSSEEESAGSGSGSGSEKERSVSNDSRHELITALPQMS